MDKFSYKELAFLKDLMVQHNLSKSDCS